MTSPVRIVLAVALVVAIVLSTTAAVLTGQAYIAVLNSESITVSATEYDLETDGEPRLHITMRIENPTRNDIVIQSATIDVFAEDVRIADEPVEMDRQRVDSGETETVVGTIPVYPEELDRTERALADDGIRIDGYVWGEIRDRDIGIRLLEGERDG